MQKKIGLYFVTFLLLLSGLIIGITLTLPYIESKVVPLLSAGVVFVLAAVQLWREIVPRDRATEPRKQPEPVVKARDEAWRRFAVELSWIVSFFVVLYLVGFLVSVPLFVFSYLKLHRHRWLTAISSAVIVTAIIHGVFNIAMKAELFKGILLQQLLW